MKSAAEYLFIGKHILLLTCQLYLGRHNLPQCYFLNQPFTNYIYLLKKLFYIETDAEIQRMYQDK